MIIRSSTLLVLLVLLALIPPGVTVARAGEPQTEFVRLARTFDPDAPGALAAALERLAATDPRFWEASLPPCPLRSAWAASLAPGDVLARLSASPEKAALVGNLSSRSDLARLILASGILDDLLPEHVPSVARIAAAAALDGDVGLLQTLLSRAEAVVRTADVLCDLPHPEGLRWLADAATGALALDAATRAKLVTFEPDVGNPRTSASLGAARVAALGRTAANDPDPAARALAARILLRADDPSIQQETLAAWRAARTVRLHEWGKLGAFAETVLTDSALAMGDRLDMLEGWLLWGWVRAEQDPVAAEATAAELRRVLAAAPPRFRGEAVRFLHDHHHVFVTTTAERMRPVPSLVGILADLDRGRAGDPEDLTALGRRMAARMRRELTQEEAYGHVRIPRRPKPPAPPISRAARVLAGLEQDPALLALLSDVLEPPAGDEDDDDYYEDDDDAGDEERARRFREAIPAALRAPLASRVRTAGDPELARWAAALLARRGTDEDVEILFRCGGHAAVETIDTPRQLAAALAFIEGGDAPNAEKVAVFERVRPPEEPEPWQAEAFDRWVRERVPTLDRDLREALDEGG